MSAGKQGSRAAAYIPCIKPFHIIYLLLVLIAVLPGYMSVIVIKRSLNPSSKLKYLHDFKTDKVTFKFTSILSLNLGNKFSSKALSVIRKLLHETGNTKCQKMTKFVID